MSYTEKPDEISKDEWLEKLNNLHVQRAGHEPPHHELPGDR